MIIKLEDNIELGLEKPAKNVFISHAHTDHLVSTKNRSILASKETKILANIDSPSFSHPSISLHRAGHVLGAKQIRIEKDGEVIVYTGDIQIKDNIIVKGAEYLEADHLIIERTYLNRVLDFPDPFDVYSDILTYIRTNASKNIIIGANRIGKAQEIIKYLNEHGIAPVVDRKIREITEKYNSLGIKLDILNADEISGPFVALVPLNVATRSLASKLSFLYNRKTLVTLATGLGSIYSFRVDKIFPLSNHASSKELIEYISLSGAKRISYL